MWKADILTYVPQTYPGILGYSLLGRALEKKIWSLGVHNIYDYGTSLHKSVDDTPAGGGAGMVLRADIAKKSLDNITKNDREKRLVIYPSPAGKVFNQAMAHDLSKHSGCVFICGRFEGIDERFLQQYDILEVSLGDFILCGGDMAAMSIIETTVRLLDGVLGNAQSRETESFENLLLEYPQYTRPREWEGMEIPPVLLSGNHAKIREWRLCQSQERTKERRLDLWDKYCRTTKAGPKSTG